MSDTAWGESRTGEEDGEGPMAFPGFVDLQVNGFGGVDFSSPELTERQFVSCCRGIIERGTAAFLPTVVTSPPEVYRRNLPLMARAMLSEQFAGRLPGIHLEGPFISGRPGAVGAHPSEWVRDPDLAAFDEMMDLSEGRLRLVTIAAELPGAAELARHAVSRGVTVSLGHQLAGDADLDALARAGATSLTHLGNGVPNVLPRHPNVIWAGLADDRLSAMLITDGHHLPASFIKTVVRAKGVERIVVVSDAASLAGMPPGRYAWQGAELVLEESGRLHDPAKGCLAGSSSTMVECMNHLASLGFLTEEELAAAGRGNPLALIGVEDESVRGDPVLEFDADARSFRGAAG